MTTNSTPLLKTNIRILRPSELKQLLSAIPKTKDRILFEALLFSGMRYVEMEYLQKHKALFDGNQIRMLSKKKKSNLTERYIRLNDNGKRAIAMFLQEKKRMPTYIGWNHNLKRWCEYAKIDPTGVSVKTTRKTWECYLVSSYPKSLEYVFLSQGHSQMTSLKFYLMIAFTNEEQDEIKNYTHNWLDVK
jgi:hypothetical protein